MDPKTETQTAPASSDELKDLVSKAVADALAPIKEALSKKVTSNMGDLPSAPKPEPMFGTDMREDNLEKGIGMARLIKAKAVAKLDPDRYRSAADVAKAWGYHKVSKALTQNDFDSGGSLVHQQFAGEMVALLRNMTVMRKAGARQLPMPGGNLTWDRQSGAATAYYGQENTAITPSEQTTDQFILSEKKLTALVPMSNDLIRNASISSEQFVRDDLLNVMALREDLAFLRGSGASSEPTGVRYRIASGNVYAETTASDGAPTLLEAKKEFGKAKQKLKDANIPEINRVWIMSPRTERVIGEIAGPGGDGTNPFEREMSEKGTLRGYKYIVSKQVPDNLVDTESELYLLEMSEVIIGDSMNLEIEVFPNATYSNSGTIVSGVSNDLSVIRAISKHDINLRHTTAGVCVTTLTWGE